MKWSPCRRPVTLLTTGSRFTPWHFQSLKKENKHFSCLAKRKSFYFYGPFLYDQLCVCVREREAMTPVTFCCWTMIAQGAIPLDGPSLPKLIYTKDNKPTKRNRNFCFFFQLLLTLFLPSYVRTPANVCFTFCLRLTTTTSSTTKKNRKTKEFLFTILLSNFGQWTV